MLQKIISIFILAIFSVIYSQTPPVSEISGFGLDDKLFIDEWKQAGCLERISPIIVTNYIDIVADYGAVGDGVFDNYQIIQDVIDNDVPTTGFTVIYFQEGTYRITDNISLCSNMLIQGKKSKETIFKFEFRRDHKNYITMWNKHNVGVENIKIIRSDNWNDILNSSVYVINISGSYNCWVKGIHSYNATSKHILIADSPEGASHNIEIRGCYLHDTTNSGPDGNGYGVVISNNANHCLVEDNVFEHLRHSMILVDNVSYNILAYNYSCDPYTSQWIVTNDWCGDIVFHGYHDDSFDNGPWANLSEGNRVSTVHFDDSHDYNGHWNSIFRNSATTTGFRIDNAVGSDTNGNERQVVINNYFHCANFLNLGPWSVEDDCPYLYAKNNWTNEGIKKSENTGLYSWISLYKEEKPEFLIPEYFLDQVSYDFYEMDANLPEFSWPVWDDHSSNKVINSSHWRRERDYFNNDDLVSLSNSYTGIYPDDYLRYLEITKQPETKYLLAGDDVAFSVEVSGLEIEEVEYQWYIKSIWPDEWVEYSSFYGGDTNEIIKPNVSYLWTGMYGIESFKFRCKITSPSTEPFYSDEASTIVFAKDAVNHHTEHLYNHDVENWVSGGTISLKDVYVHVGGILNLSSVNSISLKPGFEVDQGGLFSAKLNFMLPNNSKNVYYTIIPMEQLKGIVDPETGAEL